MEESSSGIRMTTGIILTLIGLTVILGLFIVVYNNAKTMQDNERKLRQEENDSISHNFQDRNNVLTTLQFENYYFNC